MRRLADEPRGLVLVTGTAGSGKTTTLAAMIDHINNTRDGHIVTIEDPIEVLHQDKKCIVNQREIGIDTESYADALRHVVRQDPDVILIGEMRDHETVSAALTAAEIGNLVSVASMVCRVEKTRLPISAAVSAARPSRGRASRR